MRNPNSTTIHQRVEALQGRCLWLALMVIIWLRPLDTGFRFLDGQDLAIGLIISLIFASIFQPPDHPELLMFFAVVTFAFALIQKANRWKRIRAGQIIHTFYMGTSLFDDAILPNFVRINRRVERYIDPLICALLGVFFSYFSQALGIWLLLCSVALKIYEEAIYRRDIDRRLDLMDASVNGEIASRVMDRLSQSGNEQRNPDTDSPVLPTGTAQDTLNLQRKNRATTKTNWFSKLKK